MAREITHFIGGKFVSGVCGQFDDVFDPNAEADDGPLVTKAILPRLRDHLDTGGAGGTKWRSMAAISKCRAMRMTTSSAAAYS